ncbi:MAG: hypothetical protein PHE05_04490 [Bacilli bacterium]|nr:hypothetical protein [Bacilli bacterium]
MGQGSGSVFTYNLIIVFLLIVFAFISGTLSYYKAFKVNNLIVSSVEKYEGYNRLSVVEINNSLTTIGYRIEGKFKCPTRGGRSALPQLAGTNHRYCIYKNNEGNNYRSYGVVTYINLDLPVIGDFIRIPIYTKSIRLYNF